LKQRVAELREENDYQLKLKEMNYAERIRDLTDKFMQEMENLKTKNTVVTGEKEKESSKHAEQVHDLVEKQNKELQDLGKSSFFSSKKICRIEFHLVRKEKLFCKFTFI
jgi:maltodextrin utilization protein YvdJ